MITLPVWPSGVSPEAFFVRETDGGESVLYYGTRLSENISRREPEGYLLCLNVPVARTGTQEYLPEELGLPPGSSSVPVLRPEEEVFAPETVASFEGMPVTNDHPPLGVTAENIRSLQKGHAHNVRRGAGEESDLLLADLIITDPELIRAVLNGKREISCGYMYELCEENGRYIQRRIRGNHVAVVDAGRAGRRVSIRDEQPEKQPERRTQTMKKSLLKKLTRMARDGDPEAVEALAEAVEQIIDPENTETVVAVAAEAAAEEAAETPADTAEKPAEEAGPAADEEPALAEIIARLDRIIALLSPAAMDDDPAAEIAEALGEALSAAATAESAEDPSLAEAAEQVAETIEEVAGPVSEVIGEEEDCGGPDGKAASDALRAALSAVRPALARMSRAERRKACVDIAARLRKTRGNDAAVYAALAGKRTARQAEIQKDLGRKIMASRNANFSGQ